MKIDISLVKSLSAELNNELAGSRIEKIQQPAKDVVILTCNRKKVLFSVRGNFSRVHITNINYENLKEPPMFCMLLRKHIQGAYIESVCQVNNDRIIEFNLINSDALGRKEKEKLVIEMIPQSSNIILTDESYLIIDCIRRKDFDSNLYRRFFPNNYYKFPVQNNIHEGICNLTEVSAVLDEYFSNIERRDIIKQKSKDLRTKITSSIKRIERKVGNQKIELQKTYTKDEYKHKADLIIANIYRIHKGDRVLKCNDFYNDNSEIIIELNPLKTPQQNAELLYKNYNKLKIAYGYLIEQIEKGEKQIDYLYSTLDLLLRAEDENDINDIKSELVDTGFLKSGYSVKNQKTSKSKYYEIDDIVVGKNNKQNDEITFKQSNRNYWWFHSKNYHGSHVVLKIDPPDEQMIIKAAKLAALHSEANGNCEVDYCQLKYVKKPKGALPGKVIYTNYKTIKI